MRGHDGHKLLTYSRLNAEAIGYELLLQMIKRGETKIVLSL